MFDDQQFVEFMTAYLKSPELRGRLQVPLSIARSQSPEGRVRNLLSLLLTIAAMQATVDTPADEIVTQAGLESALGSNFSDLLPLLQRAVTAPAALTQADFRRIQARLAGVIMSGSQSPLAQDSFIRECGLTLGEAQLDGYSLAHLYLCVCESGAGSCRLLHRSGQFYRFIRTRWERVDDQTIQRDVIDFLEKLKGPKMVLSAGQVLGFVKTLASVPQDLSAGVNIYGFPSDPLMRRVSFSNGIAYIDSQGVITTSGLQPHSSEFFDLVSLDFGYNPAATCPIWLRTVQMLLSDDQSRIALVQEMFGLCLSYDNSHQVFFVLEGPAGSGKSTVLNVLRALCGDGNCSSVPLSSFDKSFGLVQTYGKLVNICSEIDELAKVAESRLKDYTGGTPILFEEKYRPAFSALPTARLVFACNTAPRFTDRTDGIRRRLKMIVFDRPILPGERDTAMSSIDYWRNSGELPGIFNWALVGLQRLRRNGCFTESQVCEDRQTEHLLSSNPELDFVTEYFVEQCGNFIAEQVVMEEYAEFCQRQNRPKVSGTRLQQVIESRFPVVQFSRPTVNGHRVRGYRNLGWSNPVGMATQQRRNFSPLNAASDSHRSTLAT